jgi:hypothetical protein
VERHRFRLVTLERWVRSLARAAGGGKRGAAVRRLARRWLHQEHGDEDLGVDGSGDAVLGTMLGQEAYKRLKRNLGAIGMKPRDLFRMLMGNMLQGG